jgi:hypothetical protein
MAHSQHTTPRANGAAPQRAHIIDNIKTLQRRQEQSKNKSKKQQQQQQQQQPKTAPGDSPRAQREALGSMTLVWWRFTLRPPLSRASSSCCDGLGSHLGATMFMDIHSLAAAATATTFRSSGSNKTLHSDAGHVGSRSYQNQCVRTAVPHCRRRASHHIYCSKKGRAHAPSHSLCGY